MRESKRHWIDAAISNNSSLSQSATKAGESTAEHPNDQESDSRIIGRRERLTHALMALGKKKG